MLKIAIRDDDLNFYTTVEQLKRAYGDYLGRVPISFAAVPFIHDSQEKMETLGDISNDEKVKLLKNIEYKMNGEEIDKYYYKYAPIGENKEIVDFVKRLVNNGKAEVMLHGITHRYYSFGAEFSYNHILCEDLYMAKNYLEKTFDTRVTSFVPPSNSINIKYLEYLNENKLNLIVSASVQTKGIKERINLYVKKFKYINTILNARKNSQMYSWKYKNIEVLPGRTFNLNDTKETFLNKCRNDIDSLGYIIISTHYINHLNDEYRTKFFDLIDYFISINAEFVNVSDLLKDKKL